MMDGEEWMIPADGTSVGDAPVDAVDVVENLFPALALLRAGHEMGRQLLPCFPHGMEEGLDILFHLRRLQLVGLGEHQRERNAALAQPVDELAVDFLRFVAHVDQHENVGKLLAPENVRRYHLLQLVKHRLRTLGKAVTGQIDQIPTVVDDEVVDEKRLAGSGRCLRQSLVIAQHVDEARLAHVRPADEGIFGLMVFGTLSEGCTADDKF